MAEFTEDHKAKVRANGLKGGNPGIPRPPLIPVSPERTEAAIQNCIERVVSGKPIYNATPLRNSITEFDRRQLTRFTGITADEFTARLTTGLRGMADLVVDRIYQKLSADQFKPHELSFLLTVAVDKLQRVEGRGQLQGANVNIQINQFGPQSKDEIIARLTGQVIDLSPPPSSTYPEPVSSAPILLNEDAAS